jgi:hypothetical protein
MGAGGVEVAARTTDEIIRREKIGQTRIGLPNFYFVIPAQAGIQKI